MSVPHVPELAGTYNQVLGGDHLTHGYVYVLNEYGAAASVVLIDSDRDGDIDAHVVADSAMWVSMGMGKSSNYLI